MTIVLVILDVYVTLGLLASVPLCFVGASRFDDAALPLRVRLLLIPGAIAMWPFLLRRWISA